MAKLIARGKEIGFTILPILCDIKVHEELISHSSDYVLGYVTYNKETGERKFTYTESGDLTQINNHWSLSILKELPYCDEEGQWIVYNCSPKKAGLEFGKILTKYGECLHIDNWDIWSVECKDTKVAVITSCEIY